MGSRRVFGTLSSARSVIVWRSYVRISIGTRHKEDTFSHTSYAPAYNCQPRLLFVSLSSCLLRQSLNSFIEPMTLALLLRVPVAPSPQSPSPPRPFPSSLVFFFYLRFGASYLVWGTMISGSRPSGDFGTRLLFSIIF